MCVAAGVPDVFRSPFQTCPLDLDTDAFYPTRRSRLEAQLSSIADGQAGAQACMIVARAAAGGGEKGHIQWCCVACLACCRLMLEFAAPLVGAGHGSHWTDTAAGKEC